MATLFTYLVGQERKRERTEREREKIEKERKPRERKERADYFKPETPRLSSFLSIFYSLVLVLFRVSNSLLPGNNVEIHSIMSLPLFSVLGVSTLCFL